MKTRRHGMLLAAVLLSLLTVSPVGGADWPTHRGDIRRSSITAETLTTPLVQAWVFRVPFAPKAAFGRGLPYGTNGGGHAVEGQRIEFDNVDGVVCSGGRVFFGSIGDGMVRCLDAKTGQRLWTFQTGGPVRCAPTVWDEKVYVGSDDGWVYCLAAKDGSVVWKIQGVPGNIRVPGHGKLISIHPARTGVLVDKGVAYFAVGIFPSSGAFLYAVDARTGRIVWCNDWEGERPLSQFAPMGYIVADDQRLIVPRGRLAPSIFDRKTGKLLKHGGGGARTTTFRTLAGGVLYGGLDRRFGGRVVVVPADAPAKAPAKADAKGDLRPPPPAYTAYATGMRALRYPPQLPPPVDPKTGKPRRRRAGQPETLWSYSVGRGEVALAGETVVGGGTGKVAVVTKADGKELWAAKVDGRIESLAVADGRLYAATTAGAVYCFAPKGAKTFGDVSPAIDKNVAVSAEVKQAADALLKHAPATKRGYVLVYGVETGELVLELARRTEMLVYGVSDDAKKVAAARTLLEKAGLWGGRAIVQQWPLDAVPYTKYFANLVVSETAALTGALPGKASEAFRMTAPIRGTTVIGGPKVTGEALEQWAADTPLADAKIEVNQGARIVLNRPPLQGAGVWTHAHGGPGGNNSSHDRQVRGPLRLQWFGKPGPEQGPNRHMCASPPLSYGGRLLFCSEADIAAYDIYNGAMLWKRPMPAAWRCHTFAFGGNTAVGPEGYFVAVHGTIHRLDPVTGRTLGEYKVPAGPKGKQRMWGVVILIDGVLIGTRTIGSAALENNKWTHRRVGNYQAAQISDLLFAMDAGTGKVLWTHAPPGGFLHWNIVADGGLVFIAQAGATPKQRTTAVAEIRPFVEQLPDRRGAGWLKWLAEDPLVGPLTALDVRTGKIRWQRVVDWTGCGGTPARRSKPPRKWAPGLMMVKDGILLQSAVSGHKGGLVKEGSRGHCGVARDAGTGKVLWVSWFSNCGRPLIAGDTIYGEPWAFDLQTGDQKMVPHPVSGGSVPYQFNRPYKHCGITSASAHIIVGRSEGMGYVDILRDQGTEHFTAKRANCWVSSIFADGVALWPVGGAGCQCGLPMQLSVAFVHDDRPRRFAVYTRLSGSPIPVKHLAANLGAPGDLRDTDGRLWLGVPRPRGGMALQAGAEFYQGGAFARRNGLWNTVGGTDVPWVYTSAAHGIKRLTVTARGPDDGPASYTVRLHLAAGAADKPGRRVFNVKLQDKVVRKGLDIVKEAGKPGEALVLEFKSIHVADVLTIDLVSRGKTPTAETWPLLCGVELILEP